MNALSQAGTSVAKSKWRRRIVVILLVAVPLSVLLWTVLLVKLVGSLRRLANKRLLPAVTISQETTRIVQPRYQGGPTQCPTSSA